MITKKKIIFCTLGILVGLAVSLGFRFFSSEKKDDEVANTNVKVEVQHQVENDTNDTEEEKENEIDYEMEEESEAEIEEKTKEEENTFWNCEHTYFLKKGDFEYFAYKSKNKKRSWIYKIKVYQKGTKQSLDIPNKINGAIVTKLGAEEPQEDDGGFYKNLFGTYVEACHGCDGCNDYILNIPDIHLPDTVTEIVNSAFSGLDSIEKLKIPRDLKHMGNDAFFSCDNLVEVDVPDNYKGPCDDDVFESCMKLKTIIVSDGNKKYQSIDNMLYTKDGTTLLWAPPSLEHVNIAKQTKVIQSFAFKCSNVIDIWIPASVEKIEDNAFKDCPYIQTINVEKGNRVYEKEGTCVYESNLKRLVIAVIKDHKLTISNQVKIISGNSAMVGGMINSNSIPSVDRVDIPASVIKLEGRWLDFCSACEYSAQSIYFHGNQPPVHAAIDTDSFVEQMDLYVPVQSLDAYKKSNLNGNYIPYIDGMIAYNKDYKYTLGSDRVEILKYIGKDLNVVIPEKIKGKKVTRIGDHAFEATDIVSVNIPNSVTTIGESAFYECKQLEHVVISQNCEKLSRDSFESCKKLTSIMIPNSVKEIEANSFNGCKALESVTLPDQIEVLHGKCFKNCKSLTWVSIPASVRSIHIDCFSGCKSLTYVDMPEELEELAGGVFKNCISLKSVVIPKGISEIYGEVFMGCKNLESVEFRGEISGLSSDSFCDCRKLKHLDCLKITGSIPGGAFKNCVNLETTIEILPGCQLVEKSAFENCPKVKIKGLKNALFTDMRR